MGSHKYLISLALRTSTPVGKPNKPQHMLLLVPCDTPRTAFGPKRGPSTPFVPDKSDRPWVVPPLLRLDSSASPLHRGVSSPLVVSLRRRTSLLPIRELLAFRFPPRGGGGGDVGIGGGADADPPTETERCRRYRVIKVRCHIFLFFDHTVCRET